MSWDIDFKKKSKNGKYGETIRFKEKHHIAGGTYCIGGTTEATLNITTNYHKFYVDAFQDDEGIKVLIDKSVDDCLDSVTLAMKWMQDHRQKDNLQPADDYWKSTQGNAYASLKKLRDLIEMVIENFPKHDNIYCQIYY